MKTSRTPTLTSLNPIHSEALPLLEPLLQDDLQFAAMLSITMTLFGGILLKTNTQDEDPYGAALLSGLLVGVNVGIVILFFYQGFLVLAKPPDPSAVKVQKQALIKIVTKSMV